jgi:FSR family fosmidomycin resistance protein-like MFS transporter
MAVFTAAHFSHHLATGILVPLLPAVRQDFDLTYFSVGILVAAFTVSYGLAQLPMSVAAGRLGSSSLVAIGLVGTSLSTAALGLSGAYWHVVACLMALGLFGGTYHAPASSLLSELAGPSHRGRSLGTHIVGGSASSFLTPLLAVFIAERAGTWRASFLLLAGVPLLMAILVWSTTRGLDKAPEASGRERLADRTSLHSWWMILRPVSAMIIISVLASMVFHSVYSYLPFYLEQGHGVQGEYAAMMVGLVAGAGVMGGPIGGTLSDRRGPKWVVLASLAMSGPLLLAATWVDTRIWLPLALGVYGVAASARLAGMEALIADATSVDHRAVTLGVYYLASQVATSLITPAVGHLIDLAGPVFVFVCLGCAISPVGLIGLILSDRL